MFSSFFLKAVGKIDFVLLSSFSLPLPLHALLIPLVLYLFRLFQFFFTVDSGKNGIVAFQPPSIIKPAIAVSTITSSLSASIIPMIYPYSPYDFPILDTFFVRRLTPAIHNAKKVVLDFLTY